MVRQTSAEHRERLLDQGDLIRRVRERLPLSQVELGTALGVSPKTVIQIEKGRRPLSQWEMDVLIRVLGLSSEAFFHPPPRGQTIEAPLDDYLSDLAARVAEEGVAKDRRRRERRTPRKPPRSQP